MNQRENAVMLHQGRRSWCKPGERSAIFDLQWEKKKSTSLILAGAWGKSPNRSHKERKTGFEPATFSLARRRSTAEPLPHASSIVESLDSWIVTALFNYRTTKPSNYPTNGAEAQNRTADTTVFSRVLYQLSYLGISRPYSI